MAISLNDHYRNLYGCKVYKLAIDAGFTCPNRDGTVGTGGCIFCSEKGGGEFAETGCSSIASQLENAKRRVESKNPGGKYIAYLQAFTNTYAPVNKLKRIYLQAIAPEDVVGLAIGTRPDCLSKEILSLLQRINTIKPVTVELGLQTIHDSTATYIRRGYPSEAYMRAVKQLKDAGIEVVTHVIIGLPGENKAMAVQTTQAAVAAGTDGVKFHLLHVLRGTDLEKDYAAGKFQCLTLEAYADILDACLAALPKDTVIHRITGDGAKKDLVAPLWSADKKHVLNYLNRTLKNR